VGVIREPASVGHVHNWHLRIEEIECFADTNLGKMIAECAAQEPAKTARHMHGMNPNSKGEARQ